MKLSRLVLYLVLGVLAFVVASFVVSALFTALAIVWALVTTAVTLLALGAVGYGVYRLYKLLSGGSSSPSRSTSTLGRETTTGGEPTTDIEPGSRVDSIKQRYADGKLTESEMERLLERELDDREQDSIDRELQRERR